MRGIPTDQPQRPPQSNKDNQPPFQPENRVKGGLGQCKGRDLAALFFCEVVVQSIQQLLFPLAQAV